MTPLPSPVEVRPGVWAWPRDTAAARIVWQWEVGDGSLRIIKANYFAVPEKPVFLTHNLYAALAWSTGFEDGVRSMLP